MPPKTAEKNVEKPTAADAKAAEAAKLTAMLRDGGIFVDIKSAIDPKAVPGNLRYWSL